MKLDLHIHTRFSRTRRWGSASLIEPHQLLDKIVELGLDGLAVTDHDEIEGSLLVAEMAPQWGLLAVPGVEVSSNRGHILALGVTSMIPRGLPPEATVDLIHEQGGIAVAAHPLNIVVSLNRKDILSLPLDALETHNARSLTNRRTAKAYLKMELGQTGGSDAHSICDVGTGITETTKTYTTYRSLLNAIRRGRTSAHGVRVPYGRIARQCISTAASQKHTQLKERFLMRLGIKVA